MAKRKLKTNTDTSNSRFISDSEKGGESMDKHQFTKQCLEEEKIASQKTPEDSCDTLKKLKFKIRVNSIDKQNVLFIENLVANLAEDNLVKTTRETFFEWLVNSSTNLENPSFVKKMNKRFKLVSKQRMKTLIAQRKANIALLSNKDMFTETVPLAASDPSISQASLDEIKESHTTSSHQVKVISLNQMQKTASLSETNIRGDQQNATNAIDSFISAITKDIPLDKLYMQDQQARDLLCSDNSQPSHPVQTEERLDDVCKKIHKNPKMLKQAPKNQLLKQNIKSSIAPTDHIESPQKSVLSTRPFEMRDQTPTASLSIMENNNIKTPLSKEQGSMNVQLTSDMKPVSTNQIDFNIMKPNNTVKEDIVNPTENQLIDEEGVTDSSGSESSGSTSSSGSSSSESDGN